MTMQRQKSHRSARLSLLLATALALVPIAGSAETLAVDARTQAEAIQTGHLNMGTNRAPNGATVGINSQYLTQDGKPWLPVMGEFHYARVPSDEWEEEILKMKASGLDIIATYVVWQYHEERPGEFNFSGDHDLRRFIQLCAKHNMKVLIRIGPWAHGEVRYGGTPDWVVEQMPTRRNDPTYMEYVHRYWEKIAAQTKGLMFKDGGPIIGVQLENEYNLTGPGRGAEHISALKKMARELGFDAPLYTVTGWDGAVYPKGEVVPVFAGYPDEPWGVTATKSPPNEVYNFRFTNRVAGNAGAQTVATVAGTAVEDMKTTPFLGAEYAGGLPIMYRRRATVLPSDIAAMIPVQLGSGANLYGYYMYHGGRNPAGHTSKEENALLGGYNDMPILNYDFQSPFGEFGQQNPVLAAIRPFHLFLNSFGDRLAPMSVHAPEKQPESKTELTTLRFDVRAKAQSGFVFVNNYMRQYDMAEHKDVQFDVALPQGNLKFPATPVTVKNGAYFIWPFNFDLDGTNLTWATAQPLTRLQDAAGNVTYFFEAEDGIAPEFAFASDQSQKISVKSGQSAQADGRFIVSGVTPGREAAFVIQSGAKTVSVVVLNTADAQRASLIDFAGSKRLALTDDTLFGDTRLTLHSTGNPDFELGLFPAVTQKLSGSLALTTEQSGVFQVYKAQAKPVQLTATLKKTREEGEAPPINIGGLAKAALQPYPESFGRSAAWEISIPSTALNGVSNTYLRVHYRGDVGRLFSGAEMIDDDFWSGPSWNIGLSRFKAHLTKPFTLTVMPLRADAPIYYDDRYKIDFGGKPQIAEVSSVELVPEYELVVGPITAKAKSSSKKAKRRGN